ncbi:hypothetical protein [Nitrincola sp. MINF-07-Sa-05]|uniref:hypothetical protein n=1 Tax=Nitrincola salilacus TaxID=3400273 RepID=UPI003917FD8F
MPVRCGGVHPIAYVHLAEGGLGQDLNGYTRLQVIHDALHEYQRHLRSLSLASKNGNLDTIPGHEPEPINALI